MNRTMSETGPNLFSPTSRTHHGKSRYSWAFYLKVTILLVLVSLLYGRILVSLSRRWFEDPNYSHCVFVPLCCGLLLWISRKAWLERPVEPAASGLFFILTAMGMLVVGILGAELFLQRASFVVLLGGLVIYFAGWRTLRAIRAPWLALFLMIPLPVIVFNEIAFPLQLLASRLATGFLDLLQVPVLREGNIIHLPSMSLDVVEACSGLRSLMSLITVGVLYGLFFEPRVWIRCLIVALAIPVAVVANALRIVLSALLAQYVNASLAEGFFHAFSGFLLFLLSFAVIAGIHSIGTRFARNRMAT